jgi:hypothetical protein
MAAKKTERKKTDPKKTDPKKADPKKEIHGKGDTKHAAPKKTSSRAGAATKDGGPAPQTGELALTRLEAQMEELEEGELASANVDIPYCVAIVLGAAPHIAELRADLARLPDFAIEHVDHLPTYAQAAWQAHLESLNEAAPAANALKRLIEEAAPLREGLLSSAELLADKGLLDKSVVADIRTGTGHVDAANDLVQLSTLFRAHWPRLHDKTPFEATEVERAGAIGHELLTAYGQKRVSSSKVDVVARDRRARAFTLLVRVYDACRRGVTYVRWHEGDADEIAPSMFRRMGSRRAVEKETDGDDTPPAPEGGTVVVPTPVA